MAEQEEIAFIMKAEFDDKFSTVNLGSGLNRARNEFLEVIFNPELDFVTKLFTFACILSMVLLIVYLIVPRGVKQVIHSIDLRPGTEGSLSKSGLVCIISATSVVIFILQKQSMGKTDLQKLEEGRIEREFRLRQQFTVDMHIYNLMMLLGIWCTLNFITGLNRDKYQMEK